MYFVVTGWLFGTSLPKNTRRSVPIQSEYEHVDAATPRTCFMPVVLGAWQTREELSTWFVPRNRATFWAA